MPLLGDCVDKEENSRHPSPHLRFRTICRHILSSDLMHAQLHARGSPHAVQFHPSGAAQTHPLGAQPASSSGNLMELQHI